MRDNGVKSFSVVSLGCPKNTVDSEVAIGGLTRAGLRYVKDSSEVDLLIINTCGFIEPAREEAIETILEAVNLKENGQVKKIAVVGCLVQLYKKELEKEIPEVDFYLGIDFQKKLVQEFAPGKGYCPDYTDRILMDRGHYAYLKIADGCDNKCSFCSIPLIKGKQKSRTPEEIAAEVRYLNKLGVKELILVSQDTTRYGVDLKPQLELPELLENVLRESDAQWIRLLYCNPDFWADGLINMVRDESRLVKYFDIPIQHISDSILKSMRRVKMGSEIKELLYRIRAEIPDVAIRTSLLVGYPGESEKDFWELLDFVEEFRFERLGVFTYSPEENTPAFELGDSIPPQEKENRRSLLMEKQWEIMEEKAAELKGKRLEVIVDDLEGNFYVGRSQWDAPEIDCIVKIPKEVELKIGEIYNIEVVGNDGIDIIGKVIKGNNCGGF